MFLFALTVNPEPSFDSPIRPIIGISTITFNIFLLWAFNVYIFDPSRKRLAQHPILRYIVSYAFCISLIALAHFIIRNSGIGPPSEKIGMFWLYPYIGNMSNNTLVILIMHVILNQEDRKKLILEKAELEILNIHTLHDQLKKQLQPHFLFNSLTSLEYLVENDPKRAQVYIGLLSAYLRRFIEFSKLRVVKVVDDLRFMEQFIEIQRIRFEEAIDLNVNVPNRILQKGEVPVFTLQLLAENSIKHTQFSKKKKLRLELSPVGDNSLRFTNNTNNENEFVVDSTGTGLDNLNQRMSLVSGKPLRIYADPKSFNVEFFVGKCK